MRITPLEAFRLQFLVGATWKATPEVCLHAALCWVIAMRRCYSGCALYNHHIVE
jgi:hypothetical protein